MRAVLAALLLLLPACADRTQPDDALLFVVSAPMTAQPWVGEFVQRGAELAAAQLEADGREVRVEVLDNGGSPQRAVANARTAVSRGATAVITDGVGAVAVAEVTDPVGLPVFVVFEGGASLVDPQERPTIFRLAPANAPMSRRLADYVSEKAQRVALLSDTSSYGREGAAATRQNLGRNEIALVSEATLPDGGGDVAAQVLEARRTGAQALIVWARATGVAAVVRAARSAGWEVPVYTGPTGEDPLVRQRLADRPQWLDGLTFVSFRITSEVGPEPFAAYREAYEERFGAEEVGVEAGGRPVVQPPDWSTYAYDAVKLTAAAVDAGGPLLDALNSTVITGANGDERGFGPDDREGVSPDDMYFGRFSDLRFAPVDDDILSTGLPPVPQ
ncbi:MAG: Amino acid/amide transporter substrate-binding protein family [Frankiales bacterium]|nr:Amino acid/amide transporter substrate-binding protein family [Frankiales bacterium]